MRKTSTATFMVLLSAGLCLTKLSAQTNLSIATGTASIGAVKPDTSAILELRSTTKGLLIPRMSSSQKTAIALPATGLLVYQNNSTPGFYYYNGAAWQSLVPPGWALTGNSGTNPATNFLGTTDAQALVFKVNNQRAGYIDYTATAANTSFGYAALKSITSGGGNTANGYNALSADTSGYSNVAAGIASLNKNTNGHNQVAVGDSALFSTVNGVENTAIGSKSLYLNKAGSFNVGAGTHALYSNTTGQQLSAVGDSALYKSTTGSLNTAVGAKALYNNVSGSNNTALGALADVTAGNLTNGTAIGYQASVTASNQVRVGNSAVTSIGGYVNWSNISDGRFKKNIKDDVKGLDFIKKLKPVTYTLDISGINNFINTHAAQSSVEQVEARQNSSNSQPVTDLAAIAVKEQVVYSGFVAQDVEKTAKELNYNFSGIDAPKNSTDLYGLRYSDFVVPLVKAVQELSVQNDSIQANNQRLQKENRDLKNTVNNIQSQLTDILRQLSDVKTAQEACCFNVSPGTADAARLEQNVPNPFNANTVIRYYLPATSKNAQLMITNVSGQVLKAYTVSSKGMGQTTIYAGELASGNYFYTLIVDGKKIATKQMVLLQ